MKKLMILPFLLICCVNITSCYRFPAENEYSVVPTTNNPDLTRQEPNTSLVPSMGF